MNGIQIIKGSMMAASISMLLLAAKLANASTGHTIPVLMKDLKRGGIVTHEILASQTFSGERIPSFMVQNPGTIIGKEAKRNLRAGTPLYHKQFREVPAVRKGSLATIIFNKGRVKLTTDGTVMEDGEAGELVRILNRDSKQMLKGIVQNNGTILVN